MKLNREQEKAADLSMGYARSTACVEVVKHVLLIERVAILVNNHRVPPENIFGLTFTRNAAEEMRSRLRPLLGTKSNRVLLSTIHSFCHLILRHEGYVFEVLQGPAQLTFLRNIIKKLKFKDLSPGSALREISLAKNNLIFAEELRDLYIGDLKMERIVSIYEAYDKEKKKLMLMDFDDLLIETYKLF